MESSKRLVGHPNKAHISYILERKGLYTKLRKQLGRQAKVKDEDRTLYQMRMLLRYCSLCWRIGKLRLIFQLIATAAEAYVHSWRAILMIKLTRTAQKTVDTKVFRGRRLAALAILNFGLYVIETHIDDRLSENGGIVKYRFNDEIRRELMAARYRLNIKKDEDSVMSTKFKDAEKLITSEYTSTLQHALNLLSRSMNLGFTLHALFTNVNRDLLPIAGFSFVTSSVTYFGWLMFMSTWSGIEIKITNPLYARMVQMFDLSKLTENSDLETLGLHNWISVQYNNARAALGKAVSATPPDRWNHRDGMFTSHTAQNIYNKTFIQYFFAYIVARGNSSSLLANGAAHAITSLKTTTDLGSDVAWYSFQATKSIKAIHRAANPISAFFTITSNDLSQKYRKGASEPVIYLPRQLNGTRVGMKIEFRNVYFRYPKSTSKRWSLSRLSFTINAGSKCVLVGENGSGKSTCISLILGLHQPTKGEILINDVPIEQYDRKELYRAISVLFQSSTSLACSIREYIALGDVDAYLVDEKMTDRITDALTKSGAKEAVNNLKFGLDSKMATTYDRWDDKEGCTEQKMLYERFKEDDKDQDEDEVSEFDESEMVSDDEEEDKKSEDKDAASTDAKKESDEITTKVAADLATTPVADANNATDKKAKKQKIIDEEHPAKFSGGENAKIVMARNFLRTTDLALFDEPFAALDPLSEKQGFDAMLEHGASQTMILVTHRLYMAKRADHVIVMAKGKLIEQGTPEELLNREGKFREMYDAQKIDEESKLTKDEQKAAEKKLAAESKTDVKSD